MQSFLDCGIVSFMMAIQASKKNLPNQILFCFVLLFKDKLGIIHRKKNHFVNFTGATFVLTTHVEGSFSSTSLSGDMKIFFIANIL